MAKLQIRALSTHDHMESGLSLSVRGWNHSDTVQWDVRLDTKPRTRARY